MIVDRVAIYKALLALLSSRLKGSYQTISLDWIAPGELKPEQQPALFICPTSEDSEVPQAASPGWVMLEGFFVIYLYSPKLPEKPGVESTPRIVELGRRLQELEAALVADKDGRLTLGGKSNYCRTQGQVALNLGYWDAQISAAVPYRIHVFGGKH